MRILVVDDNPDDRALELREISTLFPGARVVEVTEAAGFDAALDAGSPDLVVTDLDIRWTSGRDVLFAVKARYPTCPVVMFTGTGDETIAVELMKAGLDDYVVKSPRQLPRLRISLRNAVEMASTRAALSDREARLTRALAHQKIVTLELHHRVNNNLQTMLSMLRMRSRLVGTETRLHLTEFAGRLEALGVVQARIYDSDDLGEVDFCAALTDIAATLTKVYHDGQVTLDTSAMAPLSLEVARAMPLSLVCYEVILNAMKHAWPDGRPGILSIRIDEAGDTQEITIADDGAGFVEQESVRGMGKRLIRSLAREAGARIELVTSPGSGTRVSLTVEAG
jgi:two-component sensor histidine kinase